MQNYIRNAEVQKIEAELDVKFHKLSQKYPEAIEDVVLARAQTLADQGTEMTDEVWDRLWKKQSDEMLGRYSARQKGSFNKQKAANETAKESGGGGGTPGQGPRKETMHQATERAIKELAGRRL